MTAIDQPIRLARKGGTSNRAMQTTAVPQWVAAAAQPTAMNQTICLIIFMVPIQTIHSFSFLFK